MFNTKDNKLTPLLLLVVPLAVFGCSDSKPPAQEDVVQTQQATTITCPPKSVTSGDFNIRTFTGVDTEVRVPLGSGDNSKNSGIIVTKGEGLLAGTFTEGWGAVENCGSSTDSYRITSGTMSSTGVFTGAAITAGED